MAGANVNFPCVVLADAPTAYQTREVAVDMANVTKDSRRAFSIEKSDLERVKMLGSYLGTKTQAETVRYLLRLGETLVAAKVTGVKIVKRKNGNVKEVLLI